MGHAEIPVGFLAAPAQKRCLRRHGSAVRGFVPPFRTRGAGLEAIPISIRLLATVWFVNTEVWTRLTERLSRGAFEEAFWLVRFGGRLSRRQHADIHDLTPRAGQATTFVLAWWEGPGVLLRATFPLVGRHSLDDIGPGPRRRSPGVSPERVWRVGCGDHLFRSRWCPVAGTSRRCGGPVGSSP